MKTLFCAVTVAIVLGVCRVAFSVTIIVTNTADSGTGSLRQALADASDGDTIDATGISGAITLTSGQLLANKSVIINGAGAAMLAVDGNATGRVFFITGGETVTISGFTIRNGHAGTTGGGIDNESGAIVTVINCTVSGNTSGLGSGIFNGGTLTITSSTFSGNTAGSGGGIYNAGSGMLTISNSTVSGNVADFGGGIFNIGTVQISNSTLSGNSGDLGGGIFNTETVEIGNTILKRGSSGGNIANNSGSIISHGFNISSDDAGGFFTGQGDRVNTDPMLGPLADNGGPTFTHRPLPASPVIDKGKRDTIPALATNVDQRGLTRPVNIPGVPCATGGDCSDIGAVEIGIGPEPTAAVSRKTHGPAGDFDIDLLFSNALGIECRTGGSNNAYRIVVTFDRPVTFSGAVVASGIGSVSGTSGSGGTQALVDLTDVANAQIITVTLLDVDDGTQRGDVPVHMGVLVGSVTASGTVNAGSVAATKVQIGQTVTNSNFRADVNANGTINGNDVSLVKSRLGTGLP